MADLPTGSTKVIVDGLKDVVKTVDSVEKAVNEIKDVNPNEVKKTNDLILVVDELKGQVKSMREEFEDFKKNTEKMISDSFKKEVAPLLEEMTKIRQKGKVTIKETRHIWNIWPWRK